jgi:hypothetical protein
VSEVEERLRRARDGHPTDLDGLPDASSAHGDPIHTQSTARRHREMGVRMVGDDAPVQLSGGVPGDHRAPRRQAQRGQASNAGVEHDSRRDVHVREHPLVDGCPQLPHGDAGGERLRPGERKPRVPTSHDPSLSATTALTVWLSTSLEVSAHNGWPPRRWLRPIHRSDRNRRPGGQSFPLVDR